MFVDLHIQTAVDVCIFVPVNATKRLATNLTKICLLENYFNLKSACNEYALANLMCCLEGNNLAHMNRLLDSTGLFISPFGISELDCATTKTDTAERSISIGRESLQVFFCTRGLGVLAGSTARG